MAIYGDEPDETHNLPLYTFPPLPSDISPQDHILGPTPSQNMTAPYSPSFSNYEQSAPASSNLPFSPHDLASLLSTHGLCAIPSIPQQSKSKGPAHAKSKKSKLQRELQGLYSSIHYDKTATLAIREGTSVAQ